MSLPPIDHRRHLDPQTLAKVGGLEIRARRIVEGLLTGAHRSPYFGSSVEFAQHRAYAQGDDIRRVDWRVFGRTDRVHVKQFEEEHLKPVTVVNNWRLLSRTFEHAVEQRWLERNPIAGKFPLKRGRRVRATPFLLTLPELVRLTQTFSPRHALFAEVLIWSGMRQSEVRALRQNDLLDEGVIVDEALEAMNPSRPVFGSTKTEQSQRFVALPPPLIEAMRRHAKYGESGPVFTIENPRKVWSDDDGAVVPRLITENNVGAWFRDARQKARIVAERDHPVPGRRKHRSDASQDPLPTAHDCRATVVSLLNELGASAAEVRRWVGHAPGSTVTDEYYSTASAFFRPDPVVMEVKQRTDLNLAEKWALLYRRAWEEYGGLLDAEFPA